MTSELRHELPATTNTLPATFVKATVLARPAKALKSDKSRLRVGIAVGVVTVLLAISVTLIFDSVISERPSARRRPPTITPRSHVEDEDFYTAGSSIATMHTAESRGRTSVLRRP